MRLDLQVATAFSLALMLLPRVSGAQATTGTIEGQVKDPQGAVLPGVAITARKVDTGGTFPTVTTGEGFYRLTYLPLGPYEVRAELSGFRTEIHTGLIVRLNETTLANFTMSIAPLAQEVTVTAAPPVIQTTKSEIHRDYDEKALTDRPLTAQVSGFAGRSVYNFATLAPGVTTPGPRFDRAFLGSGGSNVVANGTTARSSNFELDGISNIDPEDNDYRVPVSVEGVKEFEVITSNYNAEFGRAGGAQARAVSKSGTNQFQGSTYEFYYNNALFNWPGNPLQPHRCSADQRALNPGDCYADYTLNLFGAAMGGPIRKDKLFFFGMFEDNVRRGRNATSGLVPLPTERTPNTGSAASDKIIADWLKLYPAANRTDINPRLYRSTAPFNYDTPNPFARVDLNLSNATKLMGRYDVRNQDFTIKRAFVGNGGDIQDHAQTAGISLTHIFTPRTMGEFRFGYAYRRVQLPVEQGFENFPTITVSDLSTLGPTSVQFPIDRKLYDIQGIGSVTYTAGRHAVKAGYDVHRTFNDGIQSDDVRGFITFASNVYGRSSIQNFLAGTPSSYTVTLGDVNRNFRYWDFAVYVQDDFKVRDNLTLNLGLRNESVSEWQEKDQKTSFGYGNAMFNPAPRVGAAYDLGGAGRWVVRGAYGLSYDRVNFFFLRSLQFQPPVTRTLTVIPTASDQPLRVDQLGPSAGSVGGGVSTKFDVDPNFGLGKVHTWNASLEHAVTRNTSVRVSYVGSATRGLPAALVLNRAVPAADATLFNRQARRPDPSIANWTRLANASDGNYAGLQLSVERRYTQGLLYQLSYTRSRARDLASDVGFGSGDIFDSMQFAADDIFNRTGNNGPRHDDLYGPTRFDYRSIFSYNFSYELPWRRKRGLVGALASDWQLTGTAAYRDGYPVSIFCGASGGDCNLDGVSQDRPNVVDPGVIGTQFKDAPTTPGEANQVRISPAAFDQNVPPGARGNLGRNLFRVDSSFTMDAAVVRNLLLGERHRVELRFEVYDLFNNTYAGQPGLSLASLGTFGKITGVAGNRSLQIAAKYYW